MIDLRDARANADDYRRRLARKGAADLFDELLEVDRRVREIQPKVEELRAARKLTGKPTPEQLQELERIKQELQRLDEEFTAAQRRRKELLESAGYAVAVANAHERVLAVADLVVPRDSEEGVAQMIEAYLDSRA